MPALGHAARDYAAIGMSAQVPRREKLARDEALAVPRWQKQHQPVDFAALDALELPNDRTQMRRELEAPIDQRRKGRQATSTVTAP
jgi:hypothetical protein